MHSAVESQLRTKINPQQIHSHHVITLSQNPIESEETHKCITFNVGNLFEQLHLIIIRLQLYLGTPFPIPLCLTSPLSAP